MKPSRASWNAIKTKLAPTNQADLLELIGDLYALRKENQHYLHTRFLTESTALESYKDIIKTSLSPDISQPAKVAVARKAINDYQKTIGNPEGVLELMLYYVECGLMFARTSGESDGALYSSMESFFSHVLKLITGSDSRLRDKFSPRVRQLVDQARDIGWRSS